MTDVEFTIGHLAKSTGCKVPTIRYYEQIGLLPTPRRSAGNQRVYRPSVSPSLIRPADTKMEDDDQPRQSATLS